MNKLSEEIKLPEPKVDKKDVPEVKDAELPKEVEEERDIHGDDGEQAKPEAEEVKAEVEDEAKKELGDKEKAVDDINDAKTPEAKANDGQGKNVKFKGLTEKLTLDEPSDTLNEGFEDEGAHDKVDLLLELGVEPKDLLMHIVNWLPYDELDNLVNDFITDNDLEDEFDFVREDFPSSALDEAIPKDLAKAYKVASYKGTKGDNTDLQNSEYEEVTPEEAKKLYKQDPLSIKLLIKGNLIDFRDNGKPSLDHRIQYAGNDISYERSTGKLIRDTRKMPINHLLSIADKIYKIKEVDKDPELLDSRASNIESPHYRGQGLERYGIANYSTSLRGSSRPDTSRYKRYLKGSEDELKYLEDQYANGEIDGEIDQEYYEQRKSRLLNNIREYRDKLISLEGEQKDYDARRRYARSELAFAEPFKQYHDIKDRLDSIEGDLSSAKDKLQLVKEKGSDNTIKTKSNISNVMSEIEQLQKRLDILNLELEGSDEDDAEAVEQAQEKVNALEQRNLELTANLNRLLRRN